MVALLDSPCQGAYNIASGQATSILSIVKTLGELSGRSDLLRIGAIAARANDVALVLGDPAATLRDIGWQAKIGLHDGLDSTLQWWREHVPSTLPEPR
jgi:UDP-glucose 4-epimerase